MISFLYLTIQSGTPLVFATVGEMLSEKSGNLNLGVEGMMLIGAVSGFYFGYITDIPIVGIIAAILGGSLAAAVYAFLTVTLRANQVVSGLAISILGTGITGFTSKYMMGFRLSDNFRSAFSSIKLPILSSIPSFGEIFFNQNIYIYVSYIVVIFFVIYMYKTRFGLNLRMVGENPGVADACGIKISLYKYVHIIMGGALSGLGGAYLSLVYIPTWQENIVAGRGWISIALVIFCLWKIPLAMAGAYFFGALSILGFRIQNLNVDVSPYLIDMFPYIITLFVLVFMSKSKESRYSQPESLGVNYFREDR